jgi:hypothetical protein
MNANVFRNSFKLYGFRFHFKMHYIFHFTKKNPNNGHINYADGPNFAKKSPIFVEKKKQSIDLQEYAHKSLQKQL